MDSILEWGTNVVLWFQQFSPALDLPFSVLTFMGNEEFFLLLLPFIYWCLDRRTGARLVVLFMFSTWVNAVAKALGQQPRPFQYDPRVRMIREAEGWGFPSGHTQGAVVVWGYLGTRVKRRWFWIIAVLLMVLIPMSRVYLGVHFPQDLLGGYVIGGALVLLYLWLQPKIESWLADQQWGLVIGITLVLPIIMALAFPDKDGVTAVATLWGMGVGFVCERRWVGFEPSRSWWHRGLSLLIGLVVLAGLWYGLRLAFESLSSPLVLRFVRYGLVGLWGGLGAPWAFVRLGLAETKGGD